MVLFGVFRRGARAAGKRPPSGSPSSRGSDVALSRPKHGFESRRGRQPSLSISLPLPFGKATAGQARADQPACHFPRGASAGQAPQQWIALAVSGAESRRSARRLSRRSRVYTPCAVRRPSAAARCRRTDTHSRNRPELLLTPSSHGRRLALIFLTSTPAPVRR